MLVRSGPYPLPNYLIEKHSKVNKKNVEGDFFMIEYKLCSLCCINICRANKFVIKKIRPYAVVIFYRIKVL